jgi:hypothetical protein
MKGIVLIVLVVVIGMISFSSCAKNELVPWPYEINAIKGDCFNDSLLFDIELKIKKLGWDIEDTNNNRNFTTFNCYKVLPMKDTNQRNYEVYSKWYLKVNNNKLIAVNSWTAEYFVYGEGTKTLSTEKQDTSFWNVVNLFSKYCDIRDSSYIINRRPGMAPIRYKKVK